MTQTVEFECYLVMGAKLTEKGSRFYTASKSTRITQRKPALAEHEVAMVVSISLPITFFTKPQLKATMKIPDGQSAPMIVTPELATNISDIIHQQLGIRMTVAAEESST